MTRKWLVIPAATAGGLLLDYLKMPAGALVGSMLGTAVAQLLLNTKMDATRSIKRLIRVILGCYIGLGITAEGIRQLKSISGAVVIITVGMTIITLLVAYSLHRFFNWGLPEAFLGSLPAGLSEIGMNAEDFKVDPIALTTVHLMRLITILTFIPLLLKFLKIAQQMP